MEGKTLWIVQAHFVEVKVVGMDRCDLSLTDSLDSSGSFRRVKGARISES